MSLKSYNLQHTIFTQDSMLSSSMMVHHRITTKECIKDFLRNGRDGPVAWPLHSFDLFPLNFFWSLLKDIIFARASTTKNDMKERISRQKVTRNLLLSSIQHYSFL